MLIDWGTKILRLCFLSESLCENFLLVSRFLWQNRLRNIIIEWWSSHYRLNLDRKWATTNRKKRVFVVTDCYEIFLFAGLLGELRIKTGKVYVKRFDRERAFHVITEEKLVRQYWKSPSLWFFVVCGINFLAEYVPSFLFPRDRNNFYIASFNSMRRYSILSAQCTRLGLWMLQLKLSAPQVLKLMMREIVESAFCKFSAWNIFIILKPNRIVVAKTTITSSQIKFATLNNMMFDRKKNELHEIIKERRENESFLW